MNDLSPIQQLVSRAMARRRLERGWRGLWMGLLVGAAGFLLLLATHRLFPIPDRWIPVGVWIAVAAVPLGFVVGWLRSVSELETARWIDQKHDLKERLSTALELSGKPVDAEWQRLVVEDATRAAGTVDAKKLIPWTLPRLSRVCLVVVAAAVGLGFVPPYRSAAHLQKEKDKAAIREAGKQLASLTRRTIQARKPVLEKTERSLETVAELGDRLQSAQLTRGDALKDIASATDKLKQDLGDMARNPVMRRMEQAARTPGGPTAPTAQALQRQIDQLSKALGDKAAKNPEAADELKKEMQALKQSAQGLSDKEGAEAAAARSQLAQAASELARKAESMGMPIPSLDEAVAALNAAQVEQFLKDLNAAEKDLDKLADMARSLAQLQQQAEKLGKDLGEQLKNGQAQVAAETLQRMADKLQKGQMTPEELQKLLEELQKAENPAKNYGEVAKKMKEGADKAKSGDKSGAAGSLSEASKELSKMLGEMGDMEGLMAALKDLQKAQMCVGNGTGWGNSPGNRAGNGGKGGRGVGTWAEDNPWAVPDHIDDLWDNTGINRPDREGKGHTDRNTALSDNFSPTKVRGQIQPGGPMPSITLRGVSIKGQSSVGYSEAATAAQTEAQAALSQDQVPRAYQNAVRDYFDDLKK